MPPNHHLSFTKIGCRLILMLLKTNAFNLFTMPSVMRGREGQKFICVDIEIHHILHDEHPAGYEVVAVSYCGPLELVERLLPWAVLQAAVQAPAGNSVAVASQPLLPDKQQHLPCILVLVASVVARKREETNEFAVSVGLDIWCELG